MYLCHIYIASSWSSVGPYEQERKHSGSACYVSKHEKHCSYVKTCTNECLPELKYKGLLRHFAIPINWSFCLFVCLLDTTGCPHWDTQYNRTKAPESISKVNVFDTGITDEKVYMKVYESIWKWQIILMRRCTDGNIRRDLYTVPLMACGRKFSVRLAAIQLSILAKIVFVS